MKLAIQRLLVCPECHSSLELEIFRKDEDEVMEGRFRCTCDLGIPDHRRRTAVASTGPASITKDDYPEYFELVRPIAAAHGGAANGPHQDTAANAAGVRLRMDLGR